MASESRFDALVSSLVEKLCDTPYSSNTINQISEHLEELTTNERHMNRDISTVSVFCLDKLFAAMDNPVDFAKCLESLRSLIERKCSIKLLRMLAEHVLVLLETSADSPNFIQMKLKLIAFYLKILKQYQRQPRQFELPTIFSLEEILLYKLMDQIIICKNSSLQIMELKLFFVLKPYEIGVDAAKKFFPGQLHMQDAIRSFNNSSNFDECYKPFLNCLKLQVPKTIIIDVNINYIEVGRCIIKIEEIEETLSRLFVQFNCLEKYIKFCSLINGVELAYAVVHSNEIEHISSTRFESLNVVKIKMWLKNEIALETIPNSLGRTLKFSFRSQHMEKFAYHMDDTFLQSFFGNIKNGVTAFSAQPNSGVGSSFSIGDCVGKSLKIGKSDGCDASIVDYDRFRCLSSSRAWSPDASLVPSNSDDSSSDLFSDPGVDDFVTNRDITNTASDYYSAKDILGQVDNNKIQEQTLIECNTENNTNIINAKKPNFDESCKLPNDNDCKSAAFQEMPIVSEQNIAPNVFAVNNLIPHPDAPATETGCEFIPRENSLRTMFCSPLQTLVNSLKADRSFQNLFIDNRPGPSSVGRKVSKTYKIDENNQNIPVQTDTSTPERVRKINARHPNTRNIVFDSKLREIDQNIPVHAQKTRNIGQVDNNEADSSAMDISSEDDTIFPDDIVSDKHNKNICISRIPDNAEEIPVMPEEIININNVTPNETFVNAECSSDEKRLVIDLDAPNCSNVTSCQNSPDIRYNDEAINIYPNTPNKNVEVNHLELSQSASIFSMSTQELRFPGNYENSNNTPEKFPHLNDKDGNEQTASGILGDLNRETQIVDPVQVDDEFSELQGKFKKLPETEDNPIKTPIFNIETKSTRVERKRLLSLEDMSEGRITKKAHKDRKFENQGRGEAKKDKQSKKKAQSSSGNMVPENSPFKTPMLNIETKCTRVKRKRLLSLEEMGEGRIIKKAHKDRKFENQGPSEAGKDKQKSKKPKTIEEKRQRDSHDTTKSITIVRSSDASAGPSKAPATADKESRNAKERYSLVLARTIRDNSECEGNGTTTSVSPPHIAVPVPSSSTPKQKMPENDVPPPRDKGKDKGKGKFKEAAMAKPKLGGFALPGVSKITAGLKGNNKEVPPAPRMRGHSDKPVVAQHNKDRKPKRDFPPKTKVARSCAAQAQAKSSSTRTSKTMGDCVKEVAKYKRMESLRRRKHLEECAAALPDRFRQSYQRAFESILAQIRQLQSQLLDSVAGLEREEENTDDAEGE